MNKFAEKVSKIVDKMEVVARCISDDENIKEYFIETYGYLDGDDPTPALFRYMEDKFFS